MNSFQYFFNIFRSVKILPSDSVPQSPSPMYELDMSQEETLNIKEENKLEQLCLIIASDLDRYIHKLRLAKKNNITSFYSSYDYPILYKFIYTILLEYNPYFDRYEHYWLITNKRYKIHTSIKISLYQSNDNEILVECFSMDKDDKFWKIYHLLKKKCNNMKDKLMDSCEKEFFQQEFFEI